MKKVLITGGHLTPALAVMQVFKQQGWTIVYVGRTHALEGDTAISQEAQEVQRAGYEFRSLTTGRIQRRLTPRTIVSLMKIPIGLVEIFFYIRQFRPHVILTFGGYMAIPAALVGWLMGIPIVTHEQTLSPGISSRLIGKIARRICIAWEDTRTYFPQSKLIYTGNPLRQSIFQKTGMALVSITKPLLYITGGNLGAHSINTVVEEIIDELLKRFTLIHQCGNAQEYQDYERLTQKKLQLNQEFAKRFHPIEFIGLERIGWVLNSAQMIVSRAGANIVTEVLALKIPALFIPLPWSGEGEQQKNAQFLADHGAARLISQTELTGTRLLQEILQTYKERQTLAKNLEKLDHFIVPDAALRIVRVVESVV